jgi:ketosteroid isomerase-like protein
MQLESYFDAIGRDDRDAAIDVISRNIHPACEMTSVIGGAVEGREYVGSEGLAAFVDDLLGSFEVSYRDREIQEVTEDVVLCLVAARLKGRESGAEVVQPIGLVVEYEGDVVRRLTTYPDHNSARAAVESQRA